MVPSCVKRISVYIHGRFFATFLPRLQRKVFWKKPSAGISWSFFPTKNPPVNLVEVHAKWFVAHTSCVPAPLAIGATNPPGSFLQGKACIRMPRQRWSLALVASPQKGCGKSFVQCRIVRWYEMFRCLSFDGWVVWKCDIYVGWSAMTSNFDGCSWGGES